MLSGVAVNTLSKLDIRPLSTLSFAEATALWNEGFKGYFVNMTMSVDGFITRLHLENLLAEKSLSAFCGDTGAGLLLNGIRDHAGKRIAWNGGTGVAPEFRGKGVGKALVDAALALYEKEGVDYAMLEAISTNDAAIRLYRNCGYEVVGELIFLEHLGQLEPSSIVAKLNQDYTARVVPLPLVGELEFYQTLTPWQAQWQSLVVNQGIGLIVSDAAGVAAGYALFRKQFDKAGNLAAIALHQCVAHPERDDAENIVGHILQQVFAPFEVPCRRFTHNFNKSNELVVRMLELAGFNTFIEQVLMIKTLRGSL